MAATSRCPEIDSVWLRAATMVRRAAACSCPRAAAAADARDHAAAGFAVRPHRCRVRNAERLEADRPGGFGVLQSCRRGVDSPVGCRVGEASPLARVRRRRHRPSARRTPPASARRRRRPAAPARRRRVALDASFVVLPASTPSRARRWSVVRPVPDGARPQKWGRAVQRPARPYQ